MNIELTEIQQRLLDSETGVSHSLSDAPDKNHNTQTI